MQEFNQLLLAFCLRFACSRGHYEDNGDDEAVQGEGLSEDHHQNERNQNILLSVRADTSITNDTNGETGGQRGKSAAKSRGKLLVAEGVVVLPFRSLHDVLIVGDGLHCNRRKW